MAFSFSGFNGRILLNNLTEVPVTFFPTVNNSQCPFETNCSLINNSKSFPKDLRNEHIFKVHLNLKKIYYDLGLPKMPRGNIHHKINIIMIN